MNKEIMNGKLKKIRQYLMEHEEGIWQYDPEQYEDQMLRCNACNNHSCIDIIYPYCSYAEIEYIKDRDNDIEEFFNNVLWENENKERWKKHLEYLEGLAKEIRGIDYWDQDLCDNFLKEAEMETLNKCHIELLCPVIDGIFGISLI